MFLSLTLMTGNCILIITYLDIIGCRITHGVLGVLSFKLLNHIKYASSRDISRLCTFHSLWSYLPFTSAFNDCIYLLSKYQHRTQQHNLFKELWQKALKLRAPPAIRTTQGKACFGVSCPPIILWNINYKSNSEGTSHTFLDNEKLPVWSEFFLRCRLTTTSLPAAHILKVRSPDMRPLQIAQKVKYGGGPIFKVVLECRKRCSEPFLIYIYGIQCGFMPKSCWKHSNFEDR